MVGQALACLWRTTNILACTFTAGTFSWDIPTCRWGRSNRPSGWSSCARWKMATLSGGSRPRTKRWAWIRPRTWNVYRVRRLREPRGAILAHPLVLGLDRPDRDRVRIAGRGYARGSGTCVEAV